MWHTIVIYHSTIFGYIEHLCIHKASNGPIITKSMHHFYLQYPPTYEQVKAWDVECLLSLLER